MPKPSPQKLAALREATTHAARAFVEDIDYLESMVDRLETSRGELRRLSAILRRLLIEKDIASVAAPRIGRMQFCAPDNSAIYKIEKRAKLLFFASAGAKIFGVHIHTHCFVNAGQPHPLLGEQETVKRAMGDIGQNMGRTVDDLQLDNFLAQRVLCHDGLWATRRDAIRYVAHIASGVHSGTKLDPKDAIVERIKSGCSYEIADGKVQLHMLPELGPNSANLTISNGAELNFAAAKLDPALVEMLATVTWLLKAPDVHRLRDAIRAGD